MGKRQNRPPRAQRRWWGWVAIGALGLITVGVSGSWRLPGNPDASPGTPRLVVDRTEVDLGDRRFDVPAHVVFTLTNAGDGPLRLAEVPRVIAKAGC